MSKKLEEILNITQPEIEPVVIPPDTPVVETINLPFSIPR